ncbi:MAG: hypothetical protein OEU09_20460, partial [Rhodospirillales bacterium]|nr:hypothetical protein [Rhodospirillales bacterium]
LWAIGLEGYLKKPVPLVWRGVFIVAGAMLIWTDPVISASGFALGAVGLMVVFLRNRRIDEQSPAKASA